MRRALLALLCAAAGVWASEMNLPPSTPSENSTGVEGGTDAAADAAAADAAAADAVVAVQNPMPPSPSPPPIFIDWALLADNIITSSLLPGNKQSFLYRHGLTIETDTLALVAFFNNTAASYEARPFAATPPPRGPMRQCTNAPMHQYQIHQCTKCTHASMHPCTHASMHPCTDAPMQGTTPSNPYRGAMARMSEWKHQEGWSSIVTAHSEVAVQCKALYMEGGTEFKARAPPLQP